LKVIPAIFFGELGSPFKGTEAAADAGQFITATSGSGLGQIHTPVCF